MTIKILDKLRIPCYHIVKLLKNLIIDTSNTTIGVNVCVCVWFRCPITSAKNVTIHQRLHWVYLTNSKVVKMINDWLQFWKKKTKKKKQYCNNTSYNGSVQMYRKWFVFLQQSKISHFSFCNPTTSVLVIFCKSVSVIRKP